jgi:hypothetical protein
MRRPLAAVLAFAVLIVGAVTACGGDSNDAADNPTIGGKTTTSGTGPALDGTAKVDIKVDGVLYAYEGGRCDLTPDRGALSINAGRVNSDSYFGLLVGKVPGASNGSPLVAGPQKGLVTLNQGTVRVAAAAADITVAADFASGSFGGAAISASGKPASLAGSFTC